MKINYLTAAEENLMNILWRLESAYMREIMEQFVDPKPHQNTVSTFLKILVEKDFLRTEKEGRIFKYSVAVPFADYKKFLLKNFIGNYFENSGIDLVKALVENNFVPIEDLQNTFNIKPIPNFSPNSAENDTEISDFIEEITTGKKVKKGKKEKKNKKSTELKKKNKLK